MKSGYSREMFDEMVAQGDMVTDRLSFFAEATPDKKFIIYEDDEILSYRAFAQRVDRLAAALQHLGVAADTRLCVFTRNALVAATTMFAAWHAGGIYCPVNFLYHGQLLAHQLQDTAPGLIICDEGLLDTLLDAIGGMPTPRIVVKREGVGEGLARSRAEDREFADFDALLAAPAAGFVPVERGYADVANIVYTSGTTGASKGVVQPFRWMNQFSFQHRQLLNSEDVIHCDLPLYHVGGAFFLVAKAAWIGATVALYDRFSPRQFWERVRRNGATHATLLDVMVPWLMSAAPDPDDRANSLNKVHMQPLPLAHHEVSNRFGFDFVTTGFGQTESGVSFMSVIDECAAGQGTPPDLWRGRPRDEILAQAGRYGMSAADGAEQLAKGFLGMPSPLYEAVVVNEADMPCADDEVGQLCLRPRFPDLMLREYFSRPDATVKAYRNFWFHTGDACYRRADGIFHFVDRLGDVFRVRGENISSYQIEDILSRHPAIRAVAALPVPAREGSEQECAIFVELIDEEILSEQALAEFAASVLPKYMLPSYIRFVDRLPLTPTNKVEKYKLRQGLIAEIPPRSD